MLVYIYLKVLTIFLHTFEMLYREELGWGKGCWKNVPCSGQSGGGGGSLPPPLRNLRCCKFELFPKFRKKLPCDSIGVPRKWQGGNDWEISRHASHGEAMRIARGVQGHAPNNFFKWCNLVRFGVYWIRFCL